MMFGKCEKMYAHSSSLKMFPLHPFIECDGIGKKEKQKYIKFSGDFTCWNFMKVRERAMKSFAM